MSMESLAESTGVNSHKHGKVSLSSFISEALKIEKGMSA